MFFDSGGVRLHYVLEGPRAGAPIVLVHGFCSDYTLNWVGTRWQETLTQSGSLVLGLDCRGHGRSEKPHEPAAYSRAEMAADVVRLLDHLGLARADVLGYSMGARIGLELAIAHPARSGRVVLGGLGMWGSADRSELIARRLRGDDAVDDPAALMFYRFAAAREVNDLEALACCILGPQPPIDEPQLRAIERPVLVVIGDQDVVAQGGEAAARLIPGGRFLSLPGRNHMNAVPARSFKEAALEFLDAGAA
ncbi:MAG: alpha/beta fold hydrolase [Candidatus Dormibacteraeota bacterium]|nr:alpha/beta fold hydrolase [Candidatus Dormibacteraeota bacterium]